MSKLSTLEQAIKFAERNWRILPLVENGKIPALKRWPEKASNDKDRIEGWWALCPDRGYGIVTGKESCIVLDVDVKNDQPGMDSLMKIFSRRDLAEFVIVETPSGGLHIYFKPDEKIRNEQGFMPGLDIRGNGGYIIGPGTVIDGKEYSHLDGNFNDLPALPPKLIQAIGMSKAKKQQVVQRMLDEDADGIIPEGSRNEALFLIACELKDNFLSQEHVLNKMEQINEERCDPPTDLEELENIVASAFSYKPNLIKFLNKFNTTELGLSKILLHFHDEDLIYIPEFKRFAIWDGLLWEVDESLLIESRVKFITKMFADAIKAVMKELKEARAKEDEPAIARLQGYLSNYSGQEKKSGSRAGMKNIIDITRSEIVVNQCQLDIDDFKFSVNNGVVDLKTGEFRFDPVKEDYMTMRGLVEFNPDAKCPQWLAFIQTCTQGDEELQAYLKRIVGYTLTGSTSEQVFFFLHGMGANGKSTLINIVQRLVGDYHRTIPSSALMHKKYGGGNGASPELAMLRGKRLAVASELEEGERLSESLIKTLTGGDIVPARHLYGEYFEFAAKFKLVMIGNHRPHIRGGDHGIWRRIRLIPFNHSVPEGQRDPYLERKLMGELSGILNWAIEGCLEWQEQGLGLPEAVKRETEDYKDSEDILKRFFNDCCTLDDQRGELQKDLYIAYKDWAQETNEWPMSNKAFGNKLKEQELKQQKKMEGNFWVGIALGNYDPKDSDKEPNDEGSHYKI